jgi:hypothetical protein
MASFQKADLLNVGEGGKRTKRCAGLRHPVFAVNAIQPSELLQLVRLLT